MGLVMYTLETVPQTGLWQTASTGKGCCVSAVTFILLVSMWNLTYGYDHQAFSAPHSVSRTLTFKWQYPLCRQEKAAEKIKVIYIPGKIDLYSQLKKWYLIKQALNISSECIWDLKNDLRTVLPLGQSVLFQGKPHDCLHLSSSCLGSCAGVRGLFSCCITQPWARHTAQNVDLKEKHILYECCMWNFKNMAGFLL